MSQVSALAFAVVLQGCAAIPLAVVAGSLFDAGGGVLVKTGTEYTASGTARRTFNVSLDEVHASVLETFRRAQITVSHDEASAKRQFVTGNMQGRKVRVRLIPLTPVLTSMELDVKRNVLASDKATASELLAETEQVVTERTTVAMRSEETAPVRQAVAAPRRRR